MYACVLNIFLVLISRLIFLNTYRRTALVICLHICLNQPLKIQWTIRETKSICWLYLALGMLVITPLLFIYSIIICVYKSCGVGVYTYTHYTIYTFLVHLFMYLSRPWILKFSDLLVEIFLLLLTKSICLWYPMPSVCFLCALYVTFISF